MPKVLRVIKSRQWAPYKNNQSWIPFEKIPADIVADFNTKNNKLSVWFIADDLSDLGRAIAAIAANRSELANFDFALANADYLNDNSHRIEEELGELKHDEEICKLHRNIVDLTGAKLINLASIFFDSFQIKFLLPIQVFVHIKTSIEGGFLKYEKLNRGIKKDLKEKFGYPVDA